MHIELKDIAEVLKENNNFYILTHKSPDGDTLGSAFALCFALQKMKKNAKVLCSDVIPEKYSFLYKNLKLQDFKPEYIISVDVAGTQLLGDKLVCYANKIDLSIDHHLLNQKFAKLWYIDSKSAATAEIIYELIRNLKVTLDLNIANCIYTGISTDTGCFKNANTSAQSHRIAASMIDLGVDNFKIDKIMFDTKSKTKLNLEKIALDSLEFYYNDKCAIISLTNEEINKFDFCESDFDGFSAIPRQVEGVLIGIFIKEVVPGEFKISVRTDDSIDASKICAYFNGGGHRCAAGCTIYGTLFEAKNKLVNIVKRFVG